MDLRPRKKIISSLDLFSKKRGNYHLQGRGKKCFIEFEDDEFFRRKYEIPIHRISGYATIDWTAWPEQYINLSRFNYWKDQKCVYININPSTRVVKALMSILKEGIVDIHLFDDFSTLEKEHFQHFWNYFGLNFQE